MSIYIVKILKINNNKNTSYMDRLFYLFINMSIYIVKILKINNNKNISYMDRV